MGTPTTDSAPGLERRIHLIRAINLGRGSTLPMAELRRIAESLGARDVRTYIASGNMVCDAPPGFDRALETQIQQHFGFFREVISRSHPEVAAALQAHPFEVVEARYSHITFLMRAPTAEAVAKARTYETGSDRWEVIGSELHIRYANGAGRPQMNDAAIGRALEVSGTTRNLNTVRRLLHL
ncbi:DUF1697 domain-containing protein [Actinotalea sp. BY-33]|uniref:DUF1697 domain-containing protein n=1 Tax=Actinotalea soli TaxID=2819234 RepID=A0A939LQG7_9CELL|nr:DUF1697 domain-containing protein [Actinotalea soli]MBO1752551.1 DUF1697 domain-containing protein [Actinotalea soli]